MTGVRSCSGAMTSFAGHMITETSGASTHRGVGSAPRSRHRIAAIATGSSSCAAASGPSAPNTRRIRGGHEAAPLAEGALTLSVPTCPLRYRRPVHRQDFTTEVRVGFPRIQVAVNSRSPSACRTKACGCRTHGAARLCQPRAGRVEGHPRPMAGFVRPPEPWASREAGPWNGRQGVSMEPSTS